ncbi:MAG: FAD-dependent oxidoreductase [Mycobacteriales bacterium]
MRRVVVVGYGMAGARLAEELRRHDPGGTRVAVTVVGAEPHPAYNRVLLSGVLAGSLDAAAVRTHDPDWAARHHVDLRLGVAAAGIDRAGRRLALTDRTGVDYDDLVLATGARPWLPPVEGLAGEDGGPARGVATFRTLDDCARILAAARTGAPVAVLGGGLLGLEVARGLAGRGCLVTVVHPAGQVMERQLDQGAGRVLARSLEACGVAFRLPAEAVRYVPGDGLKLADGTHVDAELVVVAAGVRAETGLAVAAGLAVDGGIVVDDALRTGDPHVYAIGDCARHRAAPGGLVQPAWEQAAVLAARLTGADPEARYRGTPVVTRLKAAGVDLAALGEVHAGTEDPDLEVLRVEDPVRGRYAKLVVRADRVAGAILLGVPDAAATITQLYDRQSPVPVDRLALLLGRALPEAAEASARTLPGTAVICRCNGVSKADLVREWRGGARTEAALAAATRATTGCGGCRDAVGDVTSWLSSLDAG